MGLCSKCYRESQAAQLKKQDQQPTPVAPVEDKPVAVVVQPPPAAAEPTLQQQPQDEANPVTMDIDANAATATAKAAAAAAPTEDEEEQEGDARVKADEKPVQVNRNRCFSCNKKVGLLGFECRCGYTYCAGHRHAQDHTCTFDYAAFDRERLAKSNPAIVASKLDKF